MSDATTLPTTVAAAKAYAQAALDNSFLHRDTSFSNIVWSIFVLVRDSRTHPSPAGLASH